VNLYFRSHMRIFECLDQILRQVVTVKLISMKSGMRASDLVEIKLTRGRLHEQFDDGVAPVSVRCVERHDARSRRIVRWL